jgi:cytochrome P450
LSPLQYAFMPPAAIVSELRARSLNRAKLEQRIAQRGATKHADHFDQLLPASAPDPTPREKKQLGVVAAQLLIAGYEPISSQFLCTLMFSLQEPKLHQQLVDEIRSAFARYDNITPDALAGLPLLHAALLETLRLTVIGGGGLPRVSPGAAVDGHHIPRGVGVQYAHWAFTRSPRYFHEPRRFRPQRWLPADHPAWDPAFAGDATEHFFPFSQGPRSCPGMGLAWRETRLFVAKVLWSFDVEPVPGQKPVVFEDAFRMYGMWSKPQFWVRLLPRQGQGLD